MLDLLMQNAKIKDLLLSHFYLKNIFKMIYTTVFCLQEKEAKRQMPISKEILEHVAKSVFTFSPQKFQDLRMGNCLDVTEVAENFRDFLYQLMQNLTTVYLPLLIDLISILDEDYL